MIRYKKYQNKNEKNVTTFNKWYARAVCEETVDIAALAEHMSTHNTPFSTGAIHGMLKDMVNCIKELLMDGKNVKIDDLGIFSVGIRSKGAVTPEDFPSGDTLAGVAFQRELEDAAYRLGGGNYAAPAQRVEDFLAHRPSTGAGKVVPTYLPSVRWCDLHSCLPPFVCEALEEGLPMLGRKLRGFDSPDAVLTAVETRSSSPVRIVRDNSSFQSALRGLYPCGEGAGYAGGIMSAAADGLRVAEMILEELNHE